MKIKKVFFIPKPFRFSGILTKVIFFFKKAKNLSIAFVTVSFFNAIKGRKNESKNRKTMWFGYIIILIFSQNISAQCAMCKAVVESGDADIAEGLNSGILYLMAFPYILVGVAGFLLYRNWKKKKL